MRLSWAQTVAGGITCAVVAGLLLLPGRLLAPDQAVHLGLPQAQATQSIQAAPPLRITHLHPARAKKTTVVTTAPRFTYVASPRAVLRSSPAPTMLKAHRSAVISKLAPTAPLVRARVLAATAVVIPHHVAAQAPSTAKTIAGLTASLRKK